jgi:UDP-hydrolysing UDP-N-acetyl-D-glucosamine 2-epimerase
MRKICIFTSTRADWGLLHGVAEEIRGHEDIELQLLVSGSHLSAKFGMTVSEIEDAGFDVTTRVDVLKYDDSAQGVCRTMGVALPGYSDALAEMKPDLVVVLGDRYETLCVAVAAHVLQIPLAHIHGGETTEGAVDESFRHSITKMSQIHFPACKAYRQRVIQLGEQPDRVFDVGALGVENIRKISLIDREALEASLGFPLDQPFFLVTFHPVTLERATAGDQIDELFAALNQFPEHRVIFTKANADTDGEVINARIDSYVAEFPDRCMAVASLGLIRYLSAMKFCAAVVGNSSSGILEAPSMKVPTVNIGDRQKGRVRAPSVVDCEPERVSIKNTLDVVLDAGFREGIQGMDSPFEKCDTAAEIVKVSASIELGGLLKKSFYNLT